MVIGRLLLVGAVRALALVRDHWGGVALAVIVALVALVFGPRHEVEAVLACAIVGAAVAVAALVGGSL